MYTSVYMCDDYSHIKTKREIQLFSSAILQVVQNDTTGARQIMSLRRKHLGRQDFLEKKFFQNKLFSAAF